jgi:8-amino-7-oxononanoate synthase
LVLFFRKEHTYFLDTFLRLAESASMSRFDAAFAAASNQLAAQGLLRTLSAAPPNMLDFSSNDYLGLAHHPELKNRAAAYAQHYGTGAGASRLVSGTLDLHLQIEAKIASLKKTEAALLFASGWQANASALSSLLRFGKPALVFTDDLIHASLHHASRAAGVQNIRFRHNDMAHLKTLLEQHASAPGMRFIVTESVFSMDGDQADLQTLRALADQHRAFLYLDEAHATGVLGPNGMGLSGTLPGGADLVMGTFSKALGGFGAYIAGSRALCRWLVNRASGFIHTTALPPPILGAIDAALDLVPTMTAERATLHAHAARLRAALQGLGIDHGPSTTQIVPAILGDAQAALALAASLRADGIFAVAIRPPTVPPGTSRLRLAVSAAHTGEQLDRLIAALAKAVPTLARAA